MVATPDSATDVGSIGTRHKATVDSTTTTTTPIPSSVLDAPEKEKQHAAVDEPQSTEKTAELTCSGKDTAANDAASPNVDDDGVDYPVAWKLGLITIALCLSVFCVALDNTIIATAIPRITDEFHAVQDIGWYGASYLLTTCAVQLIYGKLYTFYSVKWVYLSGIALFEVGSVVCGATPTSVGLIIGRAIAGLGSAGIFSGALLIIQRSVPLRQRPVYMGVVGAVYGLASVAGPLMGGAFTDKLTWRWCFYINLPFGAVTVFFILIFLRLPESTTTQLKKASIKEQLLSFDLEGNFCFIPGIVSLLLALQWGGSRYAWSNGHIIGLFVVFVVLIAAFVAIQIWKQDRATVPPRVFLNKTVWSCSFFAACLGSSFFIMVYYLPIWFQSIQGSSAVNSGIKSLPLVLGLVVLSMISGAGVSALGYYSPFLIASAALMAIGAGLLSTLQIDSGRNAWIGYQCIFGFGVGLGIQQPMIAIQASLRHDQVAIGTAIIIFSQTLGGALFICVAQNVFQNKLMSSIIAANHPGVSVTDVLRFGATQVRSQFQGDRLLVVMDAYNTAITNCFYVSVAMAAFAMVGAAFVPWHSVKGKKLEMAAA